MTTTRDPSTEATEPVRAEGLRALQALAMDTAANPMFLADRNGCIQWANPAFEQLYGYPLAEIRGKTPRILKSGRQSTDFYQDLWRTIASGQVWRGQLTNRKRSGELLDVEQTVTPLRLDGGPITHFLAVYEDISHRLRTEQSFARLALFDSLTGLANRVSFQRRTAEALSRARRNDKPIAVMMVDLDYFKNVNDTLGHAAGDSLLIQVAQRMPPCLRDSDTVARLSGDEFAVLIDDLARPEQAVASAQRLLDALHEPFEVQGHSLRIGASIGIALSSSTDDGPEGLLHHADLAMYQAKTSGRGRYQFFDAAMDAAARRRYTTELALRTALREDALEIVYQPQVDLSSGAIVGAEALLRWTDPVHGVIGPDEFVNLAEQTGLIFALNDWVLRRVLSELSAWRASGVTTVPVVINVSAGHFDKVGMADSIKALLQEYCLPASAIRIEITETVMLQPSTTVHDNLRGLWGQGIAIGVDDFGTGFSSLPALRQFPIDYLKLDLSYVGGIGQPGRDEQLLRAIIGLGRTMGIQVIAEGVETEQQARFLRAEGCPLAQGFLYSPGVPGAAFLELLRAEHAYVEPAAGGA